MTPPAHAPHAGSAPRPGERPAAALRRYLTDTYVPTLMHALFHLMGVLLAFILASAWAARDTELKDLRDKLAVLRALRREANVVYRSLDNDYHYGIPPSCPNEFLTGAKEPRFKTPFWHSLFTSRYALIIGDELYREIEAKYDELENAPISQMRDSPADCAGFVRERVGDLAALVEHLAGAEAGAQREFEVLQKRWWPAQFDQQVAETVGVWILIILSPALVFAADLGWKHGVRPRMRAIPAVVLYDRALGVALLVLAGAAVALSRPLRISGPLALQTFMHLAGGILAAYAGYSGTAPALVAGILGTVFTFAGAVELLAPAAVGAPPGMTITLLGLFHLAVGTIGAWVGFRHRRPGHPAGPA